MKDCHLMVQYKSHLVVEQTLARHFRPGHSLVDLELLLVAWYWIRQNTLLWAPLRVAGKPQILLIAIEERLIQNQH